MQRSRPILYIQSIYYSCVAHQRAVGNSKKCTTPFLLFRSTFSLTWVVTIPSWFAVVTCQIASILSPFATKCYSSNERQSRTVVAMIPIPYRSPFLSQSSLAMTPVPLVQRGWQSLPACLNPPCPCPLPWDFGGRVVLDPRLGSNRLKIPPRPSFLR
jgi:hypothetical protein